MTIKNRIQVTPHELQYLSDGLVTQTLIDYYCERAKGGAGLLELSRLDVKAATGILIPEWKYDSARRHPIVSRPEIVPGLKKLTESVHQYGAKIFMEVAAWMEFYGPVSSIPFENGLQLKELGFYDISEIQNAFRIAVHHVNEAGFDGVDLHGSHGTLIENFYSPALNKRSDKYGGNLENRLRFLVELIEIVRGEIDERMALGMRMCADERIQGGVTPDYAQQMVSILDDKLDFVNVDMGSYVHFEALDQNAHQTQPLYSEPGYGVYMSEALKKSANRTKIGIAGRITDPVLADVILQRHQADYLGMTRALIADPELPRKAMEGRLSEIRPCIGTLQYCWGRSVAHEWPLRCTVNPTVGREGERGLGNLKPASKKKRILIIGAGPAGLEAARVASDRGHIVVIYERSATIGGQANLAKKIPGRSDIGAIVGWYDVQLRKNNVRVELHKEVTSRDEASFLVEEEKPDAIIFATGSVPIPNGKQMITFSEIPGWELPTVRSVDRILSDDEVLRGDVLVADSTTFVEGPGIAEWLSRKGASVTLLTPHSHLSPELSNFNQLVHITRRLSKAGVSIRTFTWVKRIELRSVLAYFIPTGEEFLIKSDYVVLNTGRRQNSVLKEYFRDQVKEIYEIGDCNVAGGRIDAAIESGYEIGASI